MQGSQVIEVVDSHTGGEPTRTVVGGFPDLGGGSMDERCAVFRKSFDYLRRALILEPRGADVWVGALLCEPQNPQAAAGVVFFNNAGYLGMCGHGTIGVVETLRHLGRISAGRHLIETPVGDVVCTLHENGEVSVENVPSYRYRQDVAVDVLGYGRVHGDIAWGGNWFFLCSGHGQELAPNRASALTAFAAAIKKALVQNGITGKDGALIDHIELFADTPDADSKNFVLCPGNAYDRSPCGTGTSAKLACLAADGQLAAGQEWVQESIIGSRFTASYRMVSDGLIVPTIRGRAYVHAESRLILNDADPFRYGIETS